MNEIKFSQSLLPYNSFGVDESCDQFFEFESKEQLAEILKSTDEKLLVLGGGSNILFTSHFKGLVLRNNIQSIEFSEGENEKMYVHTGGGVVWHDLVSISVKKGLGGIENLALIPGTAGAAPIQNIGAYGRELCDVFHHLHAMDIETGEMRRFEKSECAFGYRDSIFKNELKDKYIVTSICLELDRKAPIKAGYRDVQKYFEKHDISDPSYKDVFEAVISIRQNKLPDPVVLGNAGSFFKNPVIDLKQFANLQYDHPDIPYYDVGDANIKLAAGWLIDQCGWKGKRDGHTGCFKNQALVIVNYGGATGTEIYRFSQKVKASVFEKFGVELETEVNIF